MIAIDRLCVSYWEKEAREAVEWEGVPPLRGRKIHKIVRFVNAQSVWMGDEGDVQVGASRGLGTDGRSGGGVVGQSGELLCVEADGVSCAQRASSADEEVDLEGGSLAPGFTTFGAPLGLVEIRLEPSTNDSNVPDPLSGSVPSIIGDGVIRAVDGLMFEGRNMLLAYRGGVTRAITAPLGSGFMLGVSTAFDLGASHVLEEGALIQGETVVHVPINLQTGVSVSTQIAALRNTLVEADARTWAAVRKGDIPLVVHVDNGDIMAESGGQITKSQAIRMGTRDLEQALGLRGDAARKRDLVAYAGGDMFRFDSKVVGVVSVGRGQVELF
ncbi:hypothetical protein BD779DRAFT_308005 [Infundibulicybe gibba]|nr:hypothetical protein BD779DRAFT_308005 [Infundibulicybe gibba]